MFNFPRTLRKYSIAAASTMLILAALPPGAAHAIDLVPCGNPDYLLVEFHMGIEDPGVRRYCFKNKGVHRMHPSAGSHWWIDKISTGINRIMLHDKNGDRLIFEARHIITFPNRPPAVEAIEIL
jgi:hypothetical protein